MCSTPSSTLGGPGVIGRMVCWGIHGSWCVQEKQGRRADREGRWVLGTNSVPGPVLAASI